MIKYLNIFLKKNNITTGTDFISDSINSNSKIICKVNLNSNVNFVFNNINNKYLESLSRSKVNTNTCFETHNSSLLILVYL